ncbi:MAG: cellulose binding domain-containing protein [Reinekea sp.]|nr:cellulose binding domain-containing protein [Reinekea sp.]
MKFPIVMGMLMSFAGFAAADIDCSIGTVNKWSGGRFMVKDISVTNNSSQNQLWSVNLVFNNEVALTDFWSADVTDNGKVFNATGSDFNKQLSPGESTDFGVKGTGNFSTVRCEVTEVEQPETPELPAGNVVYSEDFSNYDVGSPWMSVNDTSIKQYCGDGHGQCLQVTYVPQDNGSDRLQTKVSIPGGEHYSLVYDIMFEDGFEFVRGGKLPGLSPSVHTTGCSPAIPNGWSVRPMWRPNGSAQAYYYGQERIERCGDGERSFEGAFVVGQWQQIALEVKLNSGLNTFDGKVELKVDGQVVSRAENINLRGAFDSATKINNFFFSTFYGGADPSWAPSKTTYIRYDNIKVINLNAGNTPSQPSEPTQPTEPDEPTTPTTPTTPTEPGDVMAYYDMNDLSSGFQTKDQWVDYWAPAKWVNGATENRLYVDDQVKYGAHGKSVRTLYPKGKRTSSDSGAQWHMDINGLVDEAYLSYWVKFNEDFDFVLGGKLPGLAGSKTFLERGEDWSARLMWREDGKVEFYTHIADDRERWWWNTEGTQAVFIPGQWHHVEMHYRLNSPGNFDGLMEGWLDGKYVAHYDDVMFRSGSAEGAESKISKVFFSTFFGGSSGDHWNATKDEFSWFDEFIVSPSRIGYPGPAQ